MADEPENHTLRLLQQMREENAAFREEMTTFRQEMTAFRLETNKRFESVDSRLGKLEAQHVQTRADLANVLEAVVATAHTVNIIAKVQAQQTKTLQIVEHDLRGIKMRIDRIEEHTGLVKA
jgi:septal ring factor EnvC (AmiA/AmiB activator)